MLPVAWHRADLLDDGLHPRPRSAAEARAAAAELDVPVRVSVTLVNDAATAVALGLRGSPTVTVDGVEASSAEGASGDRRALLDVYAVPGRGTLPYPPAAVIRRAVRRALDR